MRQSKLFTKTRREVPADEVSKNAKLLTKAGFVNKEMPGVYSILPLGMLVINKIKKIINDEMIQLGSSELLMSTLQEKEIWKKTNRWDDNKVDVWFKSKLKNDSEVGFGWSHEEPITEMMKYHINSYNDLPIIVHQFQNKLRNEVRAKSGIMRCREFIMKDMYSYSVDENEHMNFYNRTIESYKRIFNKVGLGEITYVTSASGGVFTDKFSHEFQTVCDAGEDIIYINKGKNIALNDEIFNDETISELGLSYSDFEKKKAAEVGNIFTFGTSKCEEMALYFNEKNGNKKPVYLGSYGIGVTRLMGTIVEIFSDEKGIIWPESVAPFKIHLISLGNDSKVSFACEVLYEKLKKMGIETLYDDRDLRAGEKFADSDLFGIPTRVVISEKTLKENVLEIKKRNEDKSIFVSEEDFLNSF